MNEDDLKAAQPMCQPETSEPFYTLQEAAKELGVRVLDLEHAIQNHRLPFIHQFGRKLIASSDLAVISPSGRVKIAPDAFFHTDTPLPVGYQITWRVCPLFADRVTAPESGTSTVTLAQGLPNTAHRLELRAVASTGAPPVAGVRVYCPPVK